MTTSPKQIVNRWARLDDFNPLSPVQVKDYCKFKDYKLPKDRKTKKPTTGKNAIGDLIRSHPSDEVLPLILEARHLRKAQGYLSDERLGRDGKFHPTYTFSPDTGRLASINPNFQNQPKHGVDEELAAAIRETIVPSPGMVLVELDWKAIEAVLTGWFADDPDFIRLSLLDSHSFLAWHALWELQVEWGVKGITEPPLIDDKDLEAKLKWFKKTWADFVPPIAGSTFSVRDLLKRVNHAGSYGMGPKHLSELLKISMAMAAKLMEIKAKAAPKVGAWQDEIRLQAHTQGYLENPFGYRRYFWGVYEKKKDGKLRVGEEANKALAFLPQSTAAGMLREALVSVEDLRANEFDGEFFPLVPIHDAILLEVKAERAIEVARRVKEIMQAPWPQLNGLSIEVDIQMGYNWAEMKGLKV